MKNIRHFTVITLGIILIVFVWGMAMWLILPPKIKPTDDSDKDTNNRSGLKVHTDYKTGVQYLSSPYGGLTPRLDKEGKVITVK